MVTCRLLADFALLEDVVDDVALIRRAKGVGQHLARGELRGACLVGAKVDDTLLDDFVDWDQVVLAPLFSLRITYVGIFRWSDLLNNKNKLF